MKRTLLSMLIILSVCDLFAQIEKGNILISGFGNYIKTATENGVTTNQNTTNVKSLNTGASIGYFFSNKFIFGVGLEYIHKKEVRYNSLFFNNFMQVAETAIKSQGFIPNVYMGYYIPIIPKLYFNTNLKLSFGQINSDFDEALLGSTAAIEENGAPSIGGLYIKYSHRSIKSDYFETQITPELTYNFMKSFSVYLGLGGVSYSMFDSEDDNSSWLISFNPNYWTMGIKIKL